MSIEFEIVETPAFRRRSEGRDYRQAYEKIVKFVYPQLMSNPFFGPNIKKLKGEFAEIYRYRIGDFRLFYIIREKEILVVVIDLEKRKDADR
jgi:mRNA interferase RelE/StbE